ncbi:MAG: hypothetical protein ACKVPJ_01630 [Chitinophagales bacterium]
MRFTYLFVFLLFVPTMLQAQDVGGKKKKKGNYYVLVDSGFLTFKPEQGAILKGIYEHDSLKKIECWYGFNFGDLRREFHYWNGQLIMIIESQRLYNGGTVGRVDADTIQPNYQGRYLFENSVIKSIKQDGSYSFLDTPADKNSMQETFLQMSAAYQAALDKERVNKKNRVKIKKSKS